MGGEASKQQQQESLNNNQQNFLDSEHKQKVLTFFKSRINSMEHQKQPEEFDRPVSRAGGDMFPMNGHLNGSVSQQKSLDHPKSPLSSDKIPPMAPPEQKSPLPTSNATADPQKTAPFTENVSPVISSGLQRLPSAASSVVGAQFQKPVSAVSNMSAGEFQRSPPVAPNVIATEVPRSSSASSNVISAELQRPPSAASSVIAAESHSIIQKPELSKVMNGAAVKPADGLKKGHAEGAGKDEEDDDNDVVVVSQPDVISSPDEMVVEGKIQGATVNEVRATGKPVIPESKPSESMRFETMMTTLQDTKHFALKQEFKEVECVENTLNKTLDDDKPSGKEGKCKEDKEKESPKKDHVKDEESRKKTTEIVESPRKEPEKLTEKAEVLASESVTKEVTKKGESPKTSIDTTSKYAPVPYEKSEEKTEEKPLKNNESILKEMSMKTQEPIKDKSGKVNDTNTLEKENGKTEKMTSNNDLHLKEQEIVSPGKGAELSEKKSLKKEEESNMGMKASSKPGEDKREFSTNEQGKDIGRMDISASVDATKINRESQRKEEENKADNLAGSIVKSTDKIQKDVPVTEETEGIGMKKESLKNATGDIKISHKTEEVCPKNETGHEGEKLENFSKNKIDDVKKEFTVNEKQNEIDKKEKSPKKDSEGGNEELLMQGKDKLLGKQQLFVKDVTKIKKEPAKEKEESEIVRKADPPTEEAEILENKFSKKEKEAEKGESAEAKLSTKDRKEKLEDNVTLKKLPAKDIKSTSPGKEDKILRPGNESPALSKSTTQKKPRTTSESEPDTPKKTRTAPEGTKSTPKKLAVKTTSETEGEKSPRARTPKDREDLKLKKKTAKKREKVSPEEFSKKQGNGTATNITHLKALFVSNILFVNTEIVICYVDNVRHC
jgi:hypothetical protein